MFLKSLLVSLVILMSSLSTLRADELKDYLSTFIEKTCCYTNNCCWEIKPSEVTDLGNGNYRINSTGQEIHRRDYSPDGKYWRCACDPKHDSQGHLYWDKHDKANTRCLYTPRMSF